jgi:segregation and condensation protein B
VFSAAHGAAFLQVRMSLKSKIEAVIYASEEPVTLQQLAGLLGGEAQAELDAIAAQQEALPLDDAATQHVSESASEPDGTDAASQAEGDVADAIVATVDAQAETDGSAESAEAPAEEDKRAQRDRERAVREHIRRAVDGLIREYAEGDRGIEIREVASGYRMGTKPEYHDAVRGFVKSLKPALKLTLPALETLAVVAYKQPVTAAEISEIRGVDSAGVLGGLMTRKLIATAGRKQVIGRPMLYKTTREFLLRFGLKDVQELPSMEEFERMAGELAEQEDLPMESTEAVIEQANARGDGEMLREEASQQGSQSASQQDVEGDEAGAGEAINATQSGDGGAAVDDVAAEELGIEVEETNDTEETNNTEEATAESAAGGNDEEGQQVSGAAGQQVSDGAGGSEEAGERAEEERAE